jgi:hypothetical protein
MAQISVAGMFEHEIISVRILDTRLESRAANGWELAFCFPMNANMELTNIDANLFCVFKKTS